jgi:hypothetical protein
MNTEQWVIQWEERLLRKGEAKGKAEGKAEGLRVAIERLCGVLGVKLSPARRAGLQRAGAAELEALFEPIALHKRWPKG